MPEPDTSPPHAPPPAVPRTEWWLVGLLVVVGTLLRCWQPAHMAVEHFDEGVYASNLFCPVTHTYPFRRLYAPPLLPALLEWTLIFAGGAAGSVMAVNVLAGCLLVPSVWWVGRQWFGPIAGLTAAAMANFSDVHVLYSRTALTDGLLCLWLLWGVYWAWRAILEGTPGAILMAGVCASLAWWTKYNGWLTLAISGSGLIAWLIADATAGGEPPLSRRTVRCALRWLAITTIALAGWLPYLFTLQGRGGYADIAANHARYFVGVGGWWNGIVRQLDNLVWIESWWTSIGLLAALVLTLVWRRIDGHLPNETGTSPRQFRRIIIAINAAAAAVLALALLTGGLTSVLVVVSLLGVTLNLWRSRTRNAPRRLAGWMLAAWFAGLLVAVPLYHPYLRLTLPFIVGCWLAAGLACSLLRPQWLGMTSAPHRADEFASPGLLLGTGVAVIAVSAALFAFSAWRQQAPVPAAWQNRSGLRTIAAQILATLPVDENQLVYVLGEPGLFYHLASLSDSPRRVILPSGNLDSLTAPDPSLGPITVYALLGPHTSGNLQDASANVTLLDEWAYQPSTLVLLNRYSPDQIEAGVDAAPIRLVRIAQ